MEDYNDLIQQIRNYDKSMKDIFEKRMTVLERIISNGNEKSNSLDLEYCNKIDTTKSDENKKYTNEFSYFIKNMHSLDKIYQYSKQPKTIKAHENIHSRQRKDVETVCYQGLPFSYSESAAKALFNDKILIHKISFEDVFKDVYGNIADIGVIPIENSTAGYVNDVYDLLLKYDLYINYTYIKKVDHCLACIVDSSFKDIKEVYSHPQALMQCKEYIDKYHFRAVNDINTAVAAQRIFQMNNKSIACICSPEAAIYYGLKICKKQINQKQNYTRFVAISKYLFSNENHNRISIVLRIPHKIGALDDVLSIFSYYNINLSSIYSRPDLKSPWKYLFYLDFEGNILNYDIMAILHQLEKELPFIKILGSFEA